MEELRDADWVARLKSGEAFWQGQFFTAYWRDVFAICAKILGNTADAHDIAVDVLVDFMFSYVDSLTRPAAMKGYLRLMAVRRSVRLKKRLQRNEFVDQDTFADEAEGDPEEAAGFKVLLPRLQSCLTQLNPRAQQVVKLRFGVGLTNENIGTYVGASKQHVGRIVKKSLELLKVCLEKERTRR